jgi:hypothetical protein
MTPNPLFNRTCLRQATGDGLATAGTTGLAQAPCFYWYVFHARAGVGTCLGLFLSLAACDLKTQQRVHIVTIAGLAWFGLTWLISAYT